MADLVEAKDNIAGCVKPGDAGALMRIDNDAPGLGGFGPQGLGEVRMNVGAKRRIEAGEA